MGIPQNVIDYANDNNLKSTIFVIKDGESFDSYFIDKDKLIEHIGKYVVPQNNVVDTVADLESMVGMEDGSVFEVKETRPNISVYKYISDYADGEVVSADSSGSWVELTTKGLRPPPPPPKWTKQHNYLANDVFIFKPTQNEPVDIDGKHLSKTVSYIGQYAEDTTSSSRLTLSEITKIKTEPYLPNAFDTERIHVFGNTGKTALVDSGMTISGSDTDTLTLGRVLGNTTIKSSAPIMTIDATDNGTLALNHSAGSKLVLAKKGRVGVGSYPNDNSKLKVFGRTSTESLAVGKGAYPVEDLDDFTITSDAEKASFRLLTQDSNNTTTSGALFVLDGSANGGSLDINNYDGCINLKHDDENRLSVCDKVTITPKIGFPGMAVSRAPGNPSIVGSSTTRWLLLEGGSKVPNKRKIGLGYYNDTDIFLNRSGGTTVIGVPAAAIENEGKLQVNGMVKSTGNLFRNDSSSIIDIVKQKTMHGAGCLAVQLPIDDSELGFVFTMKVTLTDIANTGTYTLQGYIHDGYLRYSYSYNGHAFYGEVFGLTISGEDGYICFGAYDSPEIDLGVLVHDFRMHDRNGLPITDNTRCDIVKLTERPDGATVVRESYITTNAIRTVANGINTFYNIGGKYVGGSNTTGICNITFPPFNNDDGDKVYAMFTLHISGKKYRGAVYKHQWEIIISGYIYKSTVYGTNISITGDSDFSNVDVGVDSNRRFFVALGEIDTNWRYGEILLDKMSVTHYGKSYNLAHDINIEFVDTPPVATTPKPKYVFKYENTNRILINTRQENGMMPYGSVSYINKYVKWDRYIRVNSGTRYNAIGPNYIYTNITVPTVDTVIPIFGTDDTVTVTEDGILLDYNYSLYYKIVDGSSTVSDDNNFLIVAPAPHTPLVGIGYIRIATAFSNAAAIIGNQKVFNVKSNDPLYNNRALSTGQKSIPTDNALRILSLTQYIYRGRKLRINLDLLLSDLQVPKGIYVNFTATIDDVTYNLGNDGKNDLPTTSGNYHFKKQVEFSLFEQLNITDYGVSVKIDVHALADGGNIKMNDNAYTINETKNGLNIGGAVVGDVFTAGSHMRITEIEIDKG